MKEQKEEEKRGGEGKISIFCGKKKNENGSSNDDDERKKRKSSFLWKRGGGHLLVWLDGIKYGERIEFWEGVRGGVLVIFALFLFVERSTRLGVGRNKS